MSTMMMMIKELTATYTLSKRGADALLQSLVSRVFLRIWVQSEQNLSDEHSLPPAYDHRVNSRSPVLVPRFASDHTVNSLSRVLVPLLATDHSVNVCHSVNSLSPELVLLVANAHSVNSPSPGSCLCQISQCTQSVSCTSPTPRQCSQCKQFVSWSHSSPVLTV